MVRFACFIGAMLVAFFPSGGAQAAAAASFRIDIPFNSRGYPVAPLWVAIDQGLFPKYGVEVSSGGQLQSPALVAALLSGERPVAISGPDAFVNADLNGADIVMIATGPRVEFSVFAVTAIHKVADLKGKIIGITSFGTTHDFITRYVLRQAGLQPSDVTFVSLGQPNLLPALSSGKIDAAVMQEQEIPMARRFPDLNEIGKDSDYDLFFYAGSLIGKESWLKAHREEALDIVRGYVAGIATIDQDKAATLQSLRKNSESADPAILESGYQSLVRLLQKVPLPDPKRLQVNLDQSRLPAAKHADPARFVDRSFVQELERDGFIGKLYQRGD